MRSTDEHIAASHQPIRQCVGCRARAPQAALLRLVVHDRRVCADPGRRLAGRGAYVHHDIQCLDRATKRGGLTRALRVSGETLDRAKLRQEVAIIIEHAASLSPRPAAQTGLTGDSEDTSLRRLTSSGPRFVLPQPRGQR